MLMRSIAWSSLKAWGVRLMKTKGRRRAIVAVARKLAVVLHRMWVDGSEFRLGAGRLPHDLTQLCRSWPGSSYADDGMDEAENVCCASERVQKRGSPDPIRYMRAAALQRDGPSRLRREA